MKVSLILAQDPNGVIGVNNQLPWRIPEDLKRFKRITSGQAVIMGRNTWDSLKVKPLPDRMNIVLSRGNLRVPNAHVRSHLSSALMTVKAHKLDAFIIGGARLLEEAIDRADEVHLTMVHTPVEPEEGDDVTYCDLSLSDDWTVLASEEHADHTYLHLERREHDD